MWNRWVGADLVPHKALPQASEPRANVVLNTDVQKHRRNPQLRT